MKLVTLLLSVAAVCGIILFSSAVAKAQYDAAIVTDHNNCLLPDGNRIIRVFPCSQAGARYKIEDGRVSTADGYCFDHGIAVGMDPRRSDPSVKLVRCHGGKSQQWYFMNSGKNKYMAQNAANTGVCMNIENEQDVPRGTRVIVWPCNFGSPHSNEKFYLGPKLSSTAVTVLFQNIPVQAKNAVLAGGGAIFSNGSRIVAAGAGNIVAAGAGNIVAAGAGNIVAAGAGNLIIDGNKIISNDGGTLRGLFSGVSLITPNGSN